MPSFDLLQDHLVRQAASNAGPPAAARAGGSRIIASEELGEVIRFAMRPLSSPVPHRPPDGVGGASAGNPDATGERRLDRDPAGVDAGAGAGAGVWQPEYAAGHKAGLAEGFRRGFDAGIAHANAVHEQHEREAGGLLAERMDMLTAAFRDRLEAIERDIANQVVTMALDVARHALRATLAVQPETIIPVVQEALSGVIDDSVRLHLYLNPRDEALVRAELGPKLAQSGCEIIADADIQAGGCRIETARAEIDATIETRWRRTLAALGHAPDGALIDPNPDAGPDAGPAADAAASHVTPVDGPSAADGSDAGTGRLP